MGGGEGESSTERRGVVISMTGGVEGAERGMKHKQRMTNNSLVM